jgi:16S rRNA (cytosine967-C5)-methyltransferase
LRRRGDLTTLAAAQTRIIDALWPLLKPGGKLLYATCSVFRAEGQDIIEPFLKRHNDARELALPDSPQPAAGGDTRGPGLQLLPVSMPSEDHDGFFYCLIEKRRP